MTVKDTKTTPARRSRRRVSHEGHKDGLATKVTKIRTPNASIPARWTAELQSVARIIFGFLLFRHGMEQVLGFPAPWVPSEPASFYGIIKLLAFPGGILIMLGLFLRPVCFVLSVMYLVFWFVGPLPDYLAEGRRLFGARGPSDPVLLNGLFFLYLALAGAASVSVIDPPSVRRRGWRPRQSETIS